MQVAPSYSVRVEVETCRRQATDLVVEAFICVVLLCEAREHEVELQLRVCIICDAVFLRRAELLLSGGVLGSAYSAEKGVSHAETDVVALARGQGGVVQECSG